MSAPSPRLNLEHGYMKRIEHIGVMRQLQVKDDALRKQETAKLARKVGQASRTARPTMPIYRPPPNKQFSSGLLAEAQASNYQQHHQQFQQPKGVHFQIDSGKPEANHQELKSALKRSKSFGGKDEVFEREGLPPEYLGLVKKAIVDPNSLGSRQLMEVVRVLCNKAVESIQSAQSTAEMCFTIIEREKGETFLESLLNSCREWYNERDKLLRSPLLGSSSGGSSGSRRWTAFISFLMELYLRLKSHQRHHQRSNGAREKLSPTSLTENQRLTLALLIYECLHITLKPPSLHSSIEIECLRSTLMTSGAHLEVESSDKMEKLISMMRDAFLDAGTSAAVRKTLLELIELRATNWEFNLQQSIYYFPYTRSVSAKYN